MKAPLRWSMGIETGTTRALIEVVTDEGIVGIGETYGTPETHAAIETAKQFMIGLDPFDTGTLQHRLGVFRIGYETTVPATLRAGLEMACYDAAGKALGRPVWSLLGGKVRDRVEVAAYLFYRHRSEDGREGGESTPEQILARTEELVEAHGFRAIKLKGGVFPPEDELRAVKSLQERFPEAPLRGTPTPPGRCRRRCVSSTGCVRRGSCWSTSRIRRPSSKGMAQVRSRTSVPLATNMCLVNYEQLAPGIRLGSVDVILSDVHFWGGFRRNQQMMAVCEAFQLAVGMHSDRELGVSTAAMVHLAAASPLLTYAIDSHYPDQEGDVITEPFEFEDGHLPVSDAPGLGVELDPDQVERYRRVYEDAGVVNEFYDPSRPGWVPALPIF